MKTAQHSRTMETDAQSSNLPLDVEGYRRNQKYTSSEMFRRVLWGFGQWLFRLSPRPCFGWRRFVLRCFGAKVGDEVHVYPSTKIYFPWKMIVEDWSAIGEDVLIYNLGQVRIGPGVAISHRAHLCAGTHDYTLPDLPLVKPPIVIGPEVWICADAFIGPGVTVGHGAVVGARAVVMHDVEPWCVVAGNPAVAIKKRHIHSR